MPSTLDNVMLTFPPRPIAPRDRALLSEWFAATQRQDTDVVAAYVSERRGDDPMRAGRIAVIVSRNRFDREPTHLVFSPAGLTLWVVATAQTFGSPQRFATLREALDSICPAWPREQEADARRAVPVW
jgi:hypothetical protein